MENSVSGPVIESPKSEPDASIVSDEFYHVHTSLWRYVWPVLYGVSAIAFFSGITLASYGVYEHEKNGYSYAQIVDSSIPIVKSAGGSLSSKVPAAKVSGSRSSGNVATTTQPQTQSVGVSNSPSNSTSTSSSPSGSGSGGSSGGGTVGGTTTGGTATNSGGASIKPDGTNTGVPAGTRMTVINGNVTVTANGTVINAEDIKGFLYIKASNVTVKNSIIEGGMATSNGAVIDIQSGTGIVLDHDEVLVAHPSVYLDDIWGNNVTIQYLNIHGGVDGMKLGGNSTVQYTWIHDLTYFSSDPNQGGKSTHNDTIQILSGIGIHIQNNNLQATSTDNSAIQITQDYGTVTNVFIESNWADGGGCTYNISGHGPNGQLLSMSGITVTNNRFGPDRKFSGCAILIDDQTTITQSGNVYDATGQPVVIQQHN